MSNWQNRTPEQVFADIAVCLPAEQAHEICMPESVFNELCSGYVHPFKPGACPEFDRRMQATHESAAPAFR